MAMLLENPAAYEGRAVRVHGFVILDYEGTALWATEVDFLAQRHHRAVWLDVPTAMSNVETLGGKRGFVSGVATWNAQGSGAYGLYRASITDISTIAPDPTDMDRARPWQNDPLFVILASLGLLGLVFAASTMSARAQAATQNQRRV